MQKITPFLWFDNNAEEAMKFYTSVFKNSKIGKVTLFPEGSPGPAGTVMVGTFQIEGKSSQPEAAKKWNVVGSKTSSACPGKSFRPF